MSETPQEQQTPPVPPASSVPPASTPPVAPTPPVQPVPPAVAPGPSAAPAKKRRTGLIILLVVLGVLFVLIAGCAILVGVVFNAASEAIDPAKNAQTGLVDGDYLLKPTSNVVINDQCSFTGTAYDAATQQEAASAVTVVGSGLECSLGTSTSVVAFTVAGGTADIVDVG